MSPSPSSPVRTKQLSVKLALAGAFCLVVAACSGPDGWMREALTEIGSSTVDKDPYRPPYRHRELHDRVPVIIDLHADTLLFPDDDGAEQFERLLTNEDRDGQVDVPRLLEGNVSLQVFSVPTKISVDIMGNSAPLLTGTYTDEAGVHGEPGEEYSRFEFIRDPNIAAYDDPNDPYAEQYEPLFLGRDFLTYASRLVGLSCGTWYEDGDWGSRWNPVDPCPEWDPSRAYVLRLLEPAERLHQAAAASDGALRVVETSDDIDQLLADQAAGHAVVGGLLSTEGLYFRGDALTAEGRAELDATFAELYGAGFRMFGLTHFIDNDFAGSSSGMGRSTTPQGAELTETGRHVVGLMIENNTIVDLAHASWGTIDAVLDIATEERIPVIASHGGFSELANPDIGCDNPRNLTNDQALRIAQTGGVVGIGYADFFVCGVEPIHFARAMRHAVDLIDEAQIHRFGDPSEPVLIGIEHVALGSDFDGGVNTYTDTANLNQYTEALVCRKTWYRPNCLEDPFTEAEVQQIMGANALRVFHEVLSGN